MVGEIDNKRNKEAIEEDVERLREWLDKQPHLPHDVEYEILLAFVTGTKTLEIAKSKLDAYFSNRNKAIKLFDEKARDVNAAFRERSKAVDMFYLTNTTPEGNGVFIISITEHFPKLFDHPHEATRMLMMLELCLLKWPNMPGGYLVFDCAGVPNNLITLLSPTIVAGLLTCFQEGYPIRMKATLCINAPPFIEFIVNKLFKPLMKAKLFERVKVTQEGSSFLEQYLPKDILPSNYGGNDKSFSELNAYWLDQLQEYRDWFLLSTKRVSDERKRPPDSQATYGINGTFRKLAVD